MLLLSAPTAEVDYRYKAMFVRAASDKLLDLIALYKARMPVYEASGDLRLLGCATVNATRGLDVFISDTKLYSVFGVRMHYQAHSRHGEIRSATGSIWQEISRVAAWHKEVFDETPALKQVQKTFKDADFFQVEIFLAFPGKQADTCH